MTDDALVWLPDGSVSPEELLREWIRSRQRRLDPASYRRLLLHEYPWHLGKN